MSKNNEPSILWRWITTLLKPKVGIPLVILLAIVLAPFAIRGHRLAAVPDIGPPLDVNRFVSTEIPDSENAYVEYQKASLLLTSSHKSRHRLPEEELESALTNGWDAASDEIREWVNKNRPALDQWKLGTQKDKARYGDPRTHNYYTVINVVADLCEFARLVKIETSRLEGRGEIEAAWEWHIALFRSSGHAGQHGSMIERLIGCRMHTTCSDGILRWSENENMTSAQLQRAISELQLDFQLTASTSQVLKSDYVMLRNSIETFTVEELVEEAGTREELGAFGLWLAGEPTLARRVTRLYFDNLLSQIDKPLSARPPIDKHSVFFTTRTQEVLLTENTSQLSATSISRWSNPNWHSHFEVH